jgi:DNA-binding transcriptional LysR family regulator
VGGAVLATASLILVAGAVLAGMGVGIAPDWDLRGALERDAVVRLTPAAPLPVRLAYAPGRKTRRLDALMSVLSAALAAITCPRPSA